MIIFGASGDLTKRKLIPSFFNLHKRNLLPDSFYIVGVARSQNDDAGFRDLISQILQNENSDLVEHFLKCCFYIQGDYQEHMTYRFIKNRLLELDRKMGNPGNHVFYLAVPPDLYFPIASSLSEEGLTCEDNNYVRVVIEKPFGRDLNSAIELNIALHKILEENQIYRMDHYLGKETIQNILMFRFANSIFEPLWNQRYIDHVQITVAESIGIEHRSGYYERAGLLRDIFQNHMLQMIAMVAMEPPLNLEPDNIRNERVKLIKSIKPFDLSDLDNEITRGQYAHGMIENKPVRAYRDEEGVPSNSQTETFVAAKLFIDNWRWKNVPFFLRSGKRLQKKNSEIVVVFKSVPHSIFPLVGTKEFPPNALVFNVQPSEGIMLSFKAKRPGPKLCISSLRMNFSYQEFFDSKLPEAYERILLDCMAGDRTLFVRNDGMEASWKIFTPVLEKWENENGSREIELYRAGSWGPESSEKLIVSTGRNWLKHEVMGYE